MFATRKCKVPVFYIGQQSNMSSTLMKLKINVVNFADCLLLLDGRFECLSILIINVFSIFDRIGHIGGRVSRILMIMLTLKKTVKQISFVFIEESSQIEMFFVDHIVSHICL